MFSSDNFLFLIKGAGVSLLLAIGSIAIGCIIGVLMAAYPRNSHDAPDIVFISGDSQLISEYYRQQACC